MEGVLTDLLDQSWWDMEKGVCSGGGGTGCRCQVCNHSPFLRWSVPRPAGLLSP